MKWLRGKIPETVSKNSLNPYSSFFKKQEDEKNEDDQTPITDEGIQNVLDASAKKGNKVRINISYKKISTDFFQKLFDDKFLKWTKDSQVKDKYILEKYLENKKEIPVLLFEDFNTTGLEGDPDIHSPKLPNGKRNDFHIFMWYIGAPVDKGSEKGGGVGVGRLTFSFSSLINTFFVYTTRNDQKSYFFGISSLGKSKETPEYDQIARFGVEKNDTKIVLPITGDIELNNIRSNFKLSRKDKEVGTTMIIPFPTESLNLKNLIKNSIDRYRYAFFNDELEMEIINIKINKETLLDVVKEYLPKDYEKYNKYFDFLNKVKEIKEANNLISLNINIENPATIKKDFFTDEELLKITKVYNEEGVVAIQVPLQLYKKIDDKNNREEKIKKINSNFKVFIKKTDYGKGTDDVIRGPMPVSDLRVCENQDNFGLILIDEPEALSFYRSAESANHRIFEKTEEVNVNYDKFNNQILLLKKSIVNIKNIITDNQSEESVDATKDWFDFDSGEESENNYQSNQTLSRGLNSHKKISLWIFDNPKSYDTKKIYHSEKGLTGIKVYSLDFKEECVDKINKIETILKGTKYEKNSEDVSRLKKQVEKLKLWSEGKNLGEIYPVKIYISCTEDLEGFSFKKAFDLHDKNLDFDFSNSLKHKIIEKKEGDIIDIEKKSNEIILSVSGPKFSYEFMFDASINKYTREGYDLIFETRIKK
jgi:hypothetical protein